MKKNLRVLHTSDWHLGRSLCGRRRGHEFALFLDWLAETIETEEVDVLLVAGDIFDSLNPSPAAQELYYRFLSRLASAPAGVQAVVISGNHDSPSLLSAPDRLLKALNIHVVGRLSSAAEDEIISLKDAGGRTRLIVAAVPYPRDRDLRESSAGESPEEKEQKLVEAISAHYAEAGRAAESILQGLPEAVPVIGMGHLFAAGGLLVEGDGVRNLYVGSLGRVPAEAFPAVFDYLALGHLHQPQLVGGDETRRYSGSPLAHSFAEAGKAKSVTLIEFSSKKPSVKVLDVPVFQRLEQIAGDWPEIDRALKSLLAEGSGAWLEIEYCGQEIVGDLKEKIAELIAGSGLEVLKLKDRRLKDLTLTGREEDDGLDELNADEVFKRCLDSHEVLEDQRPELWAAYEEILRSIMEEL